MTRLTLLKVWFCDRFGTASIRAKAATDTDDLAHAQRLLGHKTRAMTEHYTRDRKGDRVKPLR